MDTSTPQPVPPGEAVGVSELTTPGTDGLMIDDLVKGYPNGAPPRRLKDIGQAGWSVLGEDVPFPVAVLKASAIAHNSRWMQRFVGLSGACISPHGKTTMAPQLFHRQLADGAWGITVATADQIRVCRAHGIDRVLLANQLVSRQGIAYVCNELARCPDFEFYSLVDSPAGVARLADGARACGLTRPLTVLIEIGLPGGRTGCRGDDDLAAVARAVGDAAPYVSLAGIEGYEGQVEGRDSADTEDRVARYLDRLAGAVRRGLGEGWFAGGPVIVSAGGSTYYDMVVDRLAGDRTLGEVRVITRSGCYLTQDSGQYRRSFARLLERSGTARELALDMGEGLQSALEVWAQVQSRPEPGLVICTAGKRDLSFDIELPVPLAWYRSGHSTVPEPFSGAARVRQLSDQHAHVDVAADSPLAVGDLVAFGISHPCTTFDRWQMLYVVDDAYGITGAVRTFF
ncbi:MAG: amino acid deaminase [Alphaproteobacteria bacterium]